MTIDAARGAAMLFVFLAHFADMVVVTPSTRFYGEQLAHIGMVASPMFMIVSGTVLGFLSASKGEEFGAVRNRMIDRSLLLLTLAHVLISVANMPRLVHPLDAWRMVFITDTIAISALIGCFLVRVVPARNRIALGAGLYVLSWVVVLSWHPVDLKIRLIKDLIFGPFGQDTWSYVVPIMPWFALYFAASTIGEQIAQSRRRALNGLSLKLIRFGVAAIVVGVTIKFCYVLFVRLNLMAPGSEWDPFHLLTGPFAKIPPSPDYLAVFGGCGLMLLGLLLGYSTRPTLAPLVAWLALIGRNSLFVFIIQYYVYFVALHALRGLPLISWPLLFVGSVLGIIALAWWWDSRNGNRYLTVGISWLVRHDLRLAPPPSR